MNVAASMAAPIRFAMKHPPDVQDGSARRRFHHLPQPNFAKLARPPEAAHARHDHRAARPVFLHVSRVAFAHRVAAGIIAGIDALGVRFVIRIDAQPRRRPPTRCCAETSVAHAASVPSACPRPRVCALAPVAGNEKTPARATHMAAVPIRIITPTIDPLLAARSPIAAPRSTADAYPAKARSTCPGCRFCDDRAHYPLIPHATARNPR